MYHLIIFLVAWWRLSHTFAVKGDFSGTMFDVEFQRSAAGRWFWSSAPFSCPSFLNLLTLVAIFNDFENMWDIFFVYFCIKDYQAIFVRYFSYFWYHCEIFDVSKYGFLWMPKRPCQKGIRFRSEGAGGVGTTSSTDGKRSTSRHFTWGPVHWVGLSLGGTVIGTLEIIAKSLQNHCKIIEITGESLENHWKIIGKLWENHWKITGKSLENHWTIMGKSLENHWNIIGKSLEGRKCAQQNRWKANRMCQAPEIPNKTWQNKDREWYFALRALKPLHRTRISSTCRHWWSNSVWSLAVLGVWTKSYQNQR